MSDGDDALLEELLRREQAAEEGGGPSRQARHKRMGRLTARERIAALVDSDSFSELGRHVKSRHGAASDRLAANLHPGDGLVCGLATVAGRPVAVWANDPTVLRGAIGRQGAVKLSRLLDLALERKAPVLALLDSDGMRVEEGTDAVQSLGDIIVRTLRLRDAGVVQLSLVCGLCVGGAAYNAVLTDFVAMVDVQSFMFVTGGKVSKEVTGEDRELVDLGAPDLHSKVTGSCHAVVADEAAGVAVLKRVLSFLEPVVASSDPVERETPLLARIARLVELVEVVPPIGMEHVRHQGGPQHELHLCARHLRAEFGDGFLRNDVTLLDVDAIRRNAASGHREVNQCDHQGGTNRGPALTCHCSQHPGKPL